MPFVTGLLLAGFRAAATLSGMDAARTDAIADSAVEFQLPLEGEMVPSQGTGILVQAGASVRRIELSWTGAGSGTTWGESQGYGYFAAATGPLPAGSWKIVARALDSSGRELSRRAVRFSSAGMSFSAAALPGGGMDSGPAARVQNLHLALNGGFRAGASEDPLRSTTDLVREGGRVAGGDRWEPLDRNASGSALMQYDFRQGALRLRARGYTDLSESYGHATSPSRAGFDLWYGPWLETHLGDQYPAWNSLLMDGSRVRGIGLGAAATSNGAPFARIDVVYGELHPAVAAQARVFDQWVDTMPAQYARSMQAIHVGVGMGKMLTLQLAAVHSKDEFSSSDQILQDSLGGATPQENLALGADLGLKLWDGIAEFYAGGGFSLVTEDIRPSAAQDSLRSENDVELPSFLSDAFTFNLSTRGAERFLSTNGDAGGFFADNAAFRGGARFAIPLGEAGRARLDARWVHVGPQFESFARSSQEASRTGMEWTATAAVAHDQVLVVSSGAVVDNHPAVGSDVPAVSVNLLCSWTPASGAPGIHAQSGTLTSGGSGDQTRIDGWNAGWGVFGTSRALPGTLSWTADYQYAVSNSRSGTESLPLRLRAVQHNLDLSGRWRPVRNLEWRLGYQLGDSRVPLDSLPELHDQDHRLQAGCSRWLMDRRLELGLDGGATIRANEISTDISGWTQVARIRWDVTPTQVVRLSESANEVGIRRDLRLDAGWEAWF